MYTTYNSRPLPRGQEPSRLHKKRRLYLLPLVLVILCVTYAGYAAFRPLPAPKVTITPPVLPALVNVAVPWPGGSAAEQSAFGADGYGLLDQSGPQKPLPTASVAKVVTALAVLQKKPLATGRQGPTITLTQKDVDLYTMYVAKDGSVVPVYAGQEITQYQALQALMLPSANNIADTLADWAFGSMDAYTSYANAYAKKLGMAQTTISDASGYSPQTVSTATDLVLLGQAALDNPVLSEIIAQKTADFPDYGPIRNVNVLLGQSGVRGIKTGNTDEAGGVFLGAADVAVGNKKITVITAVMGAPDLAAALRGSLSLVQAAPSEFQNVAVLRSGQRVGTVTTAWGASADIKAAQDISVVAWTGTTVSPSTQTNSLTAPIKAGTAAGSLDLTFNGAKESSKLQVSSDVPGPGLRWRLTHPL